MIVKESPVEIQLEQLTGLQTFTLCFWLMTQGSYQAIPGWQYLVSFLSSTNKEFSFKVKGATSPSLLVSFDGYEFTIHNISYSKGFEPGGNSRSCSVIVRVSVVLKRTVVGDSD